ncbi:hypothetical protein [Photobacterium damselae]|uniref:hypothetical protein n=1 Tax=Photobacterium damselae TaxID=38293 RepID=UPI0010FDABD8|nr:hypothetical protein [Photobacterium damselae]TLS80656.1 hypothetical protein FD721_00520 [Photobacterium damselae subsp. damselae]
MTKMTKKEQNQQSVLNVMSFLNDIIQAPSDFVADETLRNVLKSQSVLAKYENAKYAITPCSKNTQESNADEVLEGGYDALNARRKLALEVLKDESGKGEKPNRTTKKGLELTVKELDRKIEILEKHNLMLTALLSSIKDIASNYAVRSGNSQLQADWVEQRKKISAIVSFINNKALLKELSDG